MATLITGGTGKTGTPLARLLEKAGRPFVIASRNGVSSNPAHKVAKFDWYREESYEVPFQISPNIQKLYLALPTEFERRPIDVVQPFVEFAIKKGVTKIVFLSASEISKGGPFLGEVHTYLDTLNVPYIVLRPTWFIDNIAHTYRDGIVMHNEIATGTEEGKIPFVSADDIAQAAYDALFDESWPSGRQPYVFGPELLSYDQVAEILTAELKRAINHRKLGPNDTRPAWAALNKSEQQALAASEAQFASGEEEKLFLATNDKILGKTTLRSFVQKNIALWAHILTVFSAMHMAQQMFWQMGSCIYKTLGQAIELAGTI